MRTLRDLSPDALQVGREAAAALIDKREYLTPGGLLAMLLGRFRDDISEAINGTPSREDLPRRRGYSSLDELTSVELDSVWGAVNVLLQKRFTEVMDDPALPRLLDEFRDKLIDQRRERAEIQASMPS